LVAADEERVDVQEARLAAAGWRFASAVVLRELDAAEDEDAGRRVDVGDPVVVGEDDEVEAVPRVPRRRGPGWRAAVARAARVRVELALEEAGRGCRRGGRCDGGRRAGAAAQRRGGEKGGDEAAHGRSPPSARGLPMPGAHLTTEARARIQEIGGRRSGFGRD